MVNVKRFIALAMVASMAIGSTMTSFAADPDPITENTGAGTGSEATGTGTNAWYDKNVMKVVVPTLAGAFDYKIDPEGAVSQIKKFDTVDVTSVTDTTGVIFKNKDGDSSYKVTNSSDPFTITNKSAIPVEVAVTYKAEAAAQDPIALSLLSTTIDFSASGEATGKALYLELQPTNDVGHAFTADAAGKTFNISLPTGFDGYEVKNASSSVYTFAEKSDYKDWPVGEFVLTGAINKDMPLSTWYKAKSGETAASALKAPTISVTYKFTGIADALGATADFAGTDDLYIWKSSVENPLEDGGFGTTAPTVTINGKAVTGAAIDSTYKGVVKVPFASIVKAFDSSITDAAITAMTAEEKAKYKGYVKAVKASVTSGNTYYGEIN